MNSNTKGIIVVTGTLGLLGLIYFFVNKLSKDTEEKFDNFKQAQERLGLKPVKDVIIVPFNDKNNKAQFYKNSRIVIFDKNSKVINKGTYQNGGLVITLDNGKEISGSSVYGNLLQTIK